MNRASLLNPQIISKLPPLAIKAIRTVEGVLNGLHKSPHRGQSIEFNQHKEYSPGDDIRHLDWKVLARRDRYYIKQFEDETNVRVYILLDASSSMAYPDGQGGLARISKFSYAASMALSLAYLLLRQGDSVSMTFFREKLFRSFPPRSQPSYLMALADAAETIKPQGRTSLAETLKKLSELVQKRSFIFIFSDLFDDWDTISRSLKQFVARGNDIVLFHILDPDEIEFPFKERTLFEDIEFSENRLLIDAHSIRKYYLQEVRSFLIKVEKGAGEAGIEYRRIDTTSPIETELTQFISRRQNMKKSR